MISFQWVNARVRAFHVKRKSHSLFINHKSIRDSIYNVEVWIFWKEPPLVSDGIKYDEACRLAVYLCVPKGIKSRSASWVSRWAYKIPTPPSPLSTHSTFVFCRLKKDNNFWQCCKKLKEGKVTAWVRQHLRWLSVLMLAVTSIILFN